MLHWSIDQYKCSIFVTWAPCIGPWAVPWAFNIASWDSTNAQSLSHKHVTLGHKTVQMFNVCPMGILHWAMRQYKPSMFFLWADSWVCSVGPWDSTNVQPLSHGLVASVHGQSPQSYFTGPWDSTNVQSLSHGLVALSHGTVKIMFHLCPLGLLQRPLGCPMGMLHWSMGKYKFSIFVSWACCIGLWPAVPCVCYIILWDSINVQSLSHWYVILGHGTVQIFNVCPHGFSHGHFTLGHGTVQMFSPCPMGFLHWAMGQYKC
jgi:hypothetical protein